MSSAVYKLGQLSVPQQIVFMTKQYSYCMIPWYQLREGHVLIVPRRQVASFKDLDAQEMFDIALTTKFLSTYLEKLYDAHAVTISVQNSSKNDEKNIQQTFVHVIVRNDGDFKGDEIYPNLEQFGQRLLDKHQVYVVQGTGGANEYINNLHSQTQKLQAYLNKCRQDEQQF